MGMKMSESIKEIATALCKAQAAMKPAAKDAENPHFKSRYADLASVWESIRGPLTDNGLSVVQNVITVERGIAVETQITHCSGEWYLFDPLVIPVNKVDAHGVGSAITYGKRYSLSAAVGVACELDDDDGCGATDRPPAKQEQRPQAKPTQQPKPPPAKAEPATVPALSQKDGIAVARIVAMFAETQCHEDFTAICAMLKEPDSIVNKAEEPAAVRTHVFAAIKGHKHSKPEPVEQEQEEYAA
jgi:hypothetical protein